MSGLDKEEGMKFRFFIRIIVIACIVVLCAGVAVYSYLQLDAAERQKDFNLYSLVPDDAVAVLATDRMADLMDEVNQLDCSKDEHFLYLSKLFVFLKEYLYLLADDTPHGLSKQMNKMLISFHEPDNPLDQVLYCSLGAGDADLVGRFLQKYCSDVFPSKEFGYRGERIRIYSMSDGRFVAAYLTRDFLALSFQMRLVEQVIDAYRSGSSLLASESFQRVYTGKPGLTSATVYLRMDDIEMGGQTDSLRFHCRLGDWAQFDLKLAGQAIYCSGIARHSDSVLTFTNALYGQKPIEGFPGEQLPATCFFYNSWAVADRTFLYNSLSRQPYSRLPASPDDVGEEAEHCWLNYLGCHATGTVLSCLFYPATAEASALGKSCAVLRVSLKEMAAARAGFFRALQASGNNGGHQPYYVRGKRYTAYRLTAGNLLTQFTSIASSSLPIYACFYQDALLLAPEADALQAYVRALEEGDVLAGMPAYEESVANLSPTYNYMAMGDMEALSQQPNAYVRSLPNFFFRHARFFSRFILSIQFTCADGEIYPNIILRYKGQGNLPMA